MDLVEKLERKNYERKIINNDKKSFEIISNEKGYNV